MNIDLLRQGPLDFPRNKLLPYQYSTILGKEAQRREPHLQGEVLWLHVGLQHKPA